MILVTGGNGFVGRQIVKFLIDSGKDVKLVVRNESVIKSAIKYNVFGLIFSSRILYVWIRSNTSCLTLVLLGWPFETAFVG